MPSRIRTHLRSNLVAYLALFVALGGTAAGLPGRNSVDSGDIRNSTVKSADVKDDGLTGNDVREGTLAPGVLQRRVGDGCAAGRAIRAINQDGSVSCVNVGGY